jgi:predicted GIY-YIG superfamily endonuclease
MVEIPSRLEKILEQNPPYVVYILRCKKFGHYYVGSTNNFYRRLKEHESGRGAEFTRVYGVDSVLYLEPHNSREEALRRETVWTVYLIIELGDMNLVGGGKYPHVIKTLHEREEISRLIEEYQKLIRF